MEYAEKMSSVLRESAGKLTISQSTKVFLIIFMAFLVFAHWGVGGDDATLFTTHSLAENSSLSVTGFPDTGSTSQMGDELFSENPPLAPAAALPSYHAVRMLSGVPEYDFYLDSFPSARDSSTSWLRFLATVSVSSLSGVISAWLIFRILCRLRPEAEKTNLATGILAALGSPLFAYSSVFSGTMLSVLFILSAVYLYTGESEGAKTRFLVYLLLGLSVSANYIIIAPASAFLLADLYRIYRDEIGFGFYLFYGLFAGLLPLMLYNLLTAGHALDFTLALNLLEPGKLSPTRLLELLVSPGSGLLYYSPLSVLGIFGLTELWKKDRFLSEFAIGSLILSLLLTASLSGWTDSTAFGSEYLVPASILMFIPLGVLLSELEAREKLFIYVPGAVSILFQLASTQPWGVSRSLPGHYLPNLVKQGLQSPLLTALYSGESLQLLLNPYPVRDFYLGSIMNMNLIYSHLHLIAGLFLVGGLYLFRNRLDTLMERIPRAEGKHVYLLAVLLLLSGLGTQAVYLDGWYSQVGDENLVYSRSDPSIKLSGKDEWKVISYEIDTLTPRNVSITFNGQELQNLETDGRYSGTEVLEMKKGSNTVKFESEGECTALGEITGGDDVRCTKLALRSLKISKAIGENLLPSGGLEKTESGFRVEDEAEFTVQGDGVYSLELEPRLAGRGASIQLWKDDKKMDETAVDSFGADYSTPYFQVTNFSEITLNYTCQSCDQLSLEDVSLQKYGEQSQDILYRFGRSWYPNASEDDYRWSLDDPSIYIYNYGEETRKKALWLEGRSYMEPRRFDFSLNGEEIGTRLIEEMPEMASLENGEITRVENRQFFNVELEPGENILELETGKDCSFSENPDDIRCMTYGLKNLYLTEPHPDNLSDYTDVYGAAESPLRPEEDIIGLFTSDNQSVSLEATLRAVDGEAVAYVDGREVRVKEFPTKLSTPYLNPENGTLQISFECLKEEDCRIAVEDIDYQHMDEHPRSKLYRFGYNWYQSVEHEELRWSNGNGTIYLYNFLEQPTEFKINLKAVSYNQSRETTFQLNGEHLEELEMDAQRENYTFNLTLEPGENTLEMDTEKCTEIGKVNNNNDIRCATIGLADISASLTEKWGQLTEKITYRKTENWKRTTSKGYRWASNGSKIKISNDRKTPVRKTLWMKGRSYQKHRLLDFSLNGERLGTRLVGEEKERTIIRDGEAVTDVNKQFFSIELRPGENTLQITGRNCPEKNSCKIYGLKNLYLTEPHPDNLSDFKSIYGPEKTPLEPSEDDSLKMFTDGNEKLALDSVLRAVNGKATAEIRGEKYLIDEFPTRLATRYLEPENKTIEVELDCLEKDCKVAVEEASFKSFEEHPKDLFYRYGQGWYKELEKENTRYSNGNASIYLYSFEDEPVHKSLELELASFNQSRETTFYLNGKKLRTDTVTTDLKRYRFNLTVQPGENTLEMDTEKCTEIGKVNNNNDIRCASLASTKIVY